jgi:hypothetical protein
MGQVAGEMFSEAASQIDYQDDFLIRKERVNKTPF